VAVEDNPRRAACRDRGAQERGRRHHCRAGALGVGFLAGIAHWFVARGWGQAPKIPAGDHRKRLANNNRVGI